MRNNEFAAITNEMITELIKTKQTTIFQSKIGFKRRLYLTDQAIHVLKQLDEQQRNVYTEPLQKVYPFQGKDTNGFIVVITKF
jgi:hypothetical protein